MSDLKKFMGTVSPAYGIMSGQGPISSLASKGGLGIGTAMIAREARDRREDKDKEKATGMKKGGSVKAKASKTSSASKRADGCATKGKTRGKMV
jgi:hypothetical protein